MQTAKHVAKAIASAVVTVAAYLIGVMGAEDTLADVSTIQWLGALVALGGAFGITYAIPNGEKPQQVRTRVQRGRVSVAYALMVAVLVVALLILLSVLL